MQTRKHRAFKPIFPAMFNLNRGTTECFAVTHIADLHLGFVVQPLPKIDQTSNIVVRQQRLRTEHLAV